MLCDNIRDSICVGRDWEVVAVAAVNTSLETQVTGFLKRIDLEGVTEMQKETVMSMLLQEQGSFAKTDDDKGCIKELELDIKVTDEKPIQKKYSSVARPLCAEVKA